MNIIEISEKFPIHFDNKTLEVLKSFENFHRNSVISKNTEINLLFSLRQVSFSFSALVLFDAIKFP
jgi:hypothetical protein